MAANVEGWRPPTEPPAVRSVPWAPIELAPIELAPVRDLKRVLLRYVWTICFRELMRARAIPAEVRVGVLFLAGLLMVPFMLASYIWWLLSGKRLPGRVGRRLPLPNVVVVIPFPKNLPADVHEVLTRSKSTGTAT